MSLINDLFMSPLASRVLRNNRSLPTNWKEDSDFIYSGRPTIFGNPYTLPPYTRDETVFQYTDYAKNNNIILKNVHLLSDKFMVCSCHPLECHGDFFIDNWPILSELYLVL